MDQFLCDFGFDNFMGYFFEQVVGVDGLFKFGWLLVVLICVVFMIVVIIFVSEVYFF